MLSNFASALSMNSNTWFCLASDVFIDTTPKKIKYEEKILKKKNSFEKELEKEPEPNLILNYNTFSNENDEQKQMEITDEYLNDLENTRNLYPIPQSLENLLFEENDFQLEKKSLYENSFLTENEACFMLLA
ncbi:unnamed protein product [Brachionus calyciflorus]|uniref:Uncharacterized protein n=1 Tax=Brachionus calyciflorus TaxID=104777 RepID=A0A814I7U0_9BILA|nr:unnamed protein product [Brachionus calyciflorus]